MNFFFKALAWLICLTCFTPLRVMGNSPSPYVVERQKDPIRWHAWNDETRMALKESGLPGLFSISHELNALSIAMGKETFRNEEIARQVNQRFYPIAVDKNEYPQLAAFFATYVWSKKKIKPWPLTVITTADLLPIEGGGYYPPTDDWGSQGFASVIKMVSEKWSTRQAEVLAQAKDGIEELGFLHGLASEPSFEYQPGWLSLAVENLGFQYDATHGGFTFAPKAVSFSPFKLLDLVINQGGATSDQAKTMRDKTLDAFLRGAVHDFVGGGFFAASNEESWTIPDFRKWLVVQTEAINYLSRYPGYRSIVEKTAQAVIEGFRTDSGFYSEYFEWFKKGMEASAINTWSYQELSDLLTEEELKAFAAHFGIKPEGNVSEDLDAIGSFKGRNILKALTAEDGGPLIRSGRLKLRASMQSRFELRRESVSSVDTNARVVSAFLRAGDGYRSEAADLMNRMLKTFWHEGSKRLFASAQNGEVKETEASAKGYALFIQALLDAGETLNNPAYLEKAKSIQAVFEKRFSTDSGMVLIAPLNDPGIPLNVLGFIEGESGSANSITLRNRRRLGVESNLKDHLPEEVSYAPEQFIDLITAMAGW